MLFFTESLFSNNKFYESIRVYKNLIKQEVNNERYYIELGSLLYL